MNLEYKLIEEMKQEYHQKIRQLEKEREMLVAGKRDQQGMGGRMNNGGNNNTN